MGSRPGVKRRGDWEPYARHALSFPLSLCPQATWRGLSTGAPSGSPLRCLMSWSLEVSVGGRACGHPARLPGSRGSPGEGAKGKVAGGPLPIFTLLPSPLPEMASSDIRKHQSHQGIAVVQNPKFPHQEGLVCRSELAWEPQ